MLAAGGRPLSHNGQSYPLPKLRATNVCCCYTACVDFVANVPIVTIRHARPDDLPRIVAIYNASIPGRMATADTAPVTVAERQAWFRDFDPARRPLWVHCDAGGMPMAWLSLRSFYGRPAYAATVEVGVYTAPEAHRQGRATALLAHAVESMNTLGIKTMVAFIFAHNQPSLDLFERAGFARWGLLPRIAELDGVERDVVVLGFRAAAAP